MLALPTPTPAVQACDATAWRADIDRLEDQAFAAMREASQAVADAARAGTVGSAGDRQWTDYKRLRAEAESLRARGCGTSVAQASPPSADAPPPRLALTPPPGAREARSLAAALPAPIARPPRFRVEISGLISDRQPSSASRFAVQPKNGIFTQGGPSVMVPAPGPLPPAPPVPSFPDINGDPVGYFQQTSAGPLGEGPRPEVRSWSNGLDVDLTFAPEGVDQAGWRIGAGLTIDNAITKSRTSFSSSYTPTGAPETTYGCGSVGPHNNSCSWFRRTPASFTSIFVGGGEALKLNYDAVRQTSDQVELRGSLTRAFDIASPLPGLRVAFGGEATGGWWSVEDVEKVASNDQGEFAVIHSVSGPTAGVQLVAEASGQIWGPFNWSIEGALGRKFYDIDADRKQAANDLAVGRVGGRIDYVSGSWNAFVDLERRRDLSIVSTSSGLGGRARSLDPTEVFGLGVWPVYSSRLMLGVGRTF